MAGDCETAVIAMRMEEGLDTGPVCLTERVAIGDNETFGELHDRLALLGADLIARALKKLEAGALACTPQDEAGATYAKKIEKSEARIDWQRPAEEIRNLVRGLSPSPGAWFAMGKERVRILRAKIAPGSGAPGTILSLDPLTIACGEDALQPLELQRGGKKPLDAAAFARGARLQPGTILG
jgi:methionyl-tRNA formyltransferase